MSNGSSDGNTLFAFLAGAVIGAGVGLLMAPKPGSETRKQLSDLAQKAQEKASDLRNRFHEPGKVEAVHEGADSH